ncbi:MAG: acylphosphatase [archaeon]|nr:acylphosphatase [archaeon]
MAKKSVRIYISGLVQGVLFREFVKENAERLNIKGFVRNLEDGRIEAFLEGERNDINRMVELCQKGPKSAKIKGVEIKDEKIQEFKVFKILHI